MLNKLLSPENFVHRVLLLFLPFKDEKNAIRLPAVASKQTARTRSLGCCKQEQNKV